MGLCGELEIRSLHNGINGAGLLAEAAVDALCHVDVVPGGAAAAILPLLCLNGDSLCRAHLRDQAVSQLQANSTQTEAQHKTCLLYTSPSPRD